MTLRMFGLSNGVFKKPTVSPAMPPKPDNGEILTATTGTATPTRALETNDVKASQGAENLSIPLLTADKKPSTFVADLSFTRKPESASNATTAEEEEESPSFHYRTLSG